MTFSPTVENLAVSMLLTAERELQASFPGIFDISMEEYISKFLACDSNHGYRHIPDSARQWGLSIVARFGAYALCGYHRAMLLKLITEPALTAAHRQRLPGSVESLQLEHKRRVVADACTRKLDYYSLDNDLFAKDFALCRGKLLPCGAEHIDLASGVPRRVLLQPCLKQSIRALFDLASAGGFRPWIESHWDRRLIRLFSHDGYVQFYRLVAEVLALRADLRGLSSYGWWYDPALSTVSPRLSFLRELPLQYGAILLHVGPDQQGTADALTNSIERSEQYRNGSYVPTVYLLVWPRKSLLHWAKLSSSPSLSANSMTQRD